MKKLLAALGVLPLLLAGLLFVGVSPASAHTASVSATCDGLVVDLSAYQYQPGKDAWDEKVVDSPAVEEVSHTEYEFEHAPNGVYKTRWETDPNWNANGNPHSTGWRATGNTRTVIDTPAEDEVSHTVHHAAQPEKKNTVYVLVNGQEKAFQSFHESYSRTFVFPQNGETSTWSVNVTAWDDDAYSFTKRGTVGPCGTPAQYVETSHTQTCGMVTITLHNVSPWIYPVSVEIDGVHSYGPTVDNRGDAPDDQTATRTITFPEDSGVHTVRYRVDAGTENELYKNLPVGEWTTLTVQSDCAPPPTDVCPDLPGDQPEGTDCTPPPPVDVCPDLPGDQSEGTDCTPPPPADVCPDLPGDQPEGTDCTPPVAPEEPPAPPSAPKVLKATQSAAQSAVLPNTGGPDLALLVGGILLILLGGGLTLTRRS